AVPFDAVRQLPVLPGARGQDLGPDALQKRQHLARHPLGIGGVFVAVQQEHPLVSHVRQDDFSFGISTRKPVYYSPSYDGSSAFLQPTLKRFIARSIPSVIHASTASAAVPIAASSASRSDL